MFFFRWGFLARPTSHLAIGFPPARAPCEKRAFVFVANSNARTRPRISLFFFSKKTEKMHTGGPTNE